MTPKEILLDILSQHIGEVNRISRDRLLRGIINTYNSFSHPLFSEPPSDRQMRMLVEELRSTHEGHDICSSLRGGYFKARDKNELLQSLRSDWARVTATAKRLRAQAKHADLADQLPLDIPDEDLTQAALMPMGAVGLLS